MKYLFGFYNGCYWLCIQSIDELVAHLDNIIHQRKMEDFFLQQLLSGKTIFVNDCGGWHCGDLDEKKDFIVSERFPTAKQRKAYLTALVDINIDSLCEQLGVSRAELLTMESPSYSLGFPRAKVA